MAFYRYFSSEDTRYYDELVQEYRRINSILHNTVLSPANEEVLEKYLEEIRALLDNSYFSKLCTVACEVWGFFLETIDFHLNAFHVERFHQKDPKLRRLITFDFDSMYQKCLDYAIAKGFTEDFAHIIIIIYIFSKGELETELISRMIHYRDNDFMKIKFFIEALQKQKELGVYDMLYDEYYTEINVIIDLYTNYEELYIGSSGDADGDAGGGGGVGGVGVASAEV